MAKRRKNENGAGTKPIQRSDGRWAAAVTLDDGTRQWFYGRTSTEVRAKLAEALDRVSDGRPVTDSAATVRDFFEEWSTSSLEASNRRPRTRALYRQLLATHVLPVVGSRPLRELRPGHIERVLLSMDAAGKAVSTRRSTFNALSALLADAKRDDLIARNPLDSLRRPTGRTAESRHLERDEALRLLAAARGDRFEALWIVMLSTGIRRGEAVGLEWSDVDLDGGTIRIRRTVSRVDGVGLLVGEPKTERGRRTIPLPPMAVESLRRHRTRQSEERLRSKVWYEPEVVFSTHHGTRLEPNNVSRALKALALHAGISGTISPHTLRHTFASTLLGEGEDLAVVSELLGHGSSVVTLTVYQHVLRRNRDRAAGRMEAFLSADNNSDNNAVGSPA